MMMRTLVLIGTLAYAAVASAATDALDEVNALRARSGMPAFQRDDALTQASMAAADYRAANGVSLHTGNDFGFIPVGASAVGSGTGLGSAGGGWHSCYATSGYAYAGAAYAESGGRRYMHIFVTSRPNGPLGKLGKVVEATVEAIVHPVQTIQNVRENHPRRLLRNRR